MGSISVANGSDDWGLEDHLDVNEEGKGTGAGANEAKQTYVCSYTRAVKAIIATAETLAGALRHNEVSDAHLVAALALEPSGQAELRKRKHDVKVVHHTALQSLIDEPTVPGLQAVPMSDSLEAIMLRADELARGCETAKRAISTQDLIESILQGEASDRARKLLTGIAATTPAEEARDHAKALRDTLDTYIAQLNNAVAMTKTKLDSAVAQIDAQKGAQQDLRVRLVRTENAVAHVAKREAPSVRPAASVAVGVLVAGVFGYLLGKGIPALSSVTSLLRGISA